MASKMYLWIEDRKGKAGFRFWETLMQQLCPDVIVESKNNNSELVKAVKALSDEENQYRIVFDNSFDNLQAYQELKLLKRYVDAKRNIVMIDVICFEYILLEFAQLIEWIYALDDEFLEKRGNAVLAREKLIESVCSGQLDYKKIREVMEYDVHFKEHNIEQLSAKLLFDLTRNTGFEVSKGRIGDCWVQSCCDWKERQMDDRCGLDGRRLTVREKMKSIYQETSLRTKFSDAGLEVSL